MGYVIVRTDGKYVAPPGQERSYTDKLQEAWIFTSCAEAMKNVCEENEQVFSLDTIFHRSN